MDGNFTLEPMTATARDTWRIKMKQTDVGATVCGGSHSLTNQDSCPTSRVAARPIRIPACMTIFCLFMVQTKSKIF